MNIGKGFGFKELKKGNIIIITLIISLLFSLSIIKVGVYSLSQEKMINKTSLILKQDRLEEMIAYDAFVNNGQSVCDYDIHGFEVTVYFPEGTKTYVMYGEDGIILIRKVRDNE